MMAVDYWLAARFLEPVEALRKSYEATIEKRGADAVLRMHIEDGAVELPDLFKPPELTEARAWYFMGTSIGFIREETAQGPVFAVFEDEKGMPFQQPEKLAVSRDGFYRGNIEERLGKLRNVARVIRDRATVQRQQEWKEKLNAAISRQTEIVHTETGGNTVAPVYREWLKLKDELERIWMEAAR